MIKKWLRNARLVRQAANFVRPLPELGVDKFLLDCTNIVHIGANKGQERFLYEKLNLNVIWIEALPQIHAELIENLRGFRNQTAVLALLTEKSGELSTFHIAGNEGASSSLFDFKKHSEIWPDVKMVGCVKLSSKTLNEVVSGCGMIDAIVIDTQGAELLVLKGGLDVLKKVRYVKAEAADFEAYAGGCTLDQLSNFLIDLGFVEKQRHLFACKHGTGSYYDVLWQRETHGRAV